MTYSYPQITESQEFLSISNRLTVDVSLYICHHEEALRDLSHSATTKEGCFSCSHYLSLEKQQR
jgi:hypothetical protein